MTATNRWGWHEGGACHQGPRSPRPSGGAFLLWRMRRWVFLVLSSTGCFAVMPGLIWGQPVAEPEPYQYSDFIRFVADLTFQPDGKALALVGTSLHPKDIQNSDESKLLIFDYPSGRLRTLMGTDHSIGRIAYSPDGRRIAAGCYNAVQLWEAASGKLLAENEGHWWPVLSMCFSRDGKTLLTAAARDHQVKVWDGITGKPRANFRFPLGKRGLRPDDPAVAPRDRAPLFVEMKVPCEGLRGIVLLPDGKTAAVSMEEDKNVWLWDITTGKQKPPLKTDHLEAVAGLALSPDGRVLATGGEGVSQRGNDSSVRLWDTRTHKRLAILDHSDGAVLNIVFSPDGKTLAALGNGILTIWDLEKGKERFALEGEDRESLVDFAVTPDWKTVATIMQSRTFRLCFWDMETGKEVFPGRR
jgi:WD40 repeat protein